jgi:hypothetical protein
MKGRWASRLEKANWATYRICAAGKRIEKGGKAMG